MKTSSNKKVGPGRPKNPEICKLVDELQVSRSRAAQLLKENGSANSTSYSEEMARLRLEIAAGRARLNKASAESQELQNAKLRNELVARREVFGKGAALGAAMTSVLAGWGSSLPAQLAGQSELVIHQIIQEEIDKLIGLIRSSVQGFADEK